jgi:MFS family permease
MPVGFFAVSALQRPGADESLVGQFTLAMVSIQVVSALATGLVADRYGNKIALIAASSAMLLASATAFFAPTAGWFVLVYMFVGIHAGSEVMVRYNIAIEFGPVEQRSTYVALTNTMIAPFYLAGIIGGVISELFGFRALFAVGMAFSLVGITILARGVRDPRFHPSGVGHTESSHGTQ